MCCFAVYYLMSNANAVFRVSEIVLAVVVVTDVCCSRKSIKAPDNNTLVNILVLEADIVYNQFYLFTACSRIRHIHVVIVLHCSAAEK